MELSSYAEPTLPHYANHRYPQQDNQEMEKPNVRSQSNPSRIIPEWKQKQLRKKMKKQIYGEHYNYEYRKPRQNKMYRIQEDRNTQIQRANRMLLEKIQNIFKRSAGRRLANAQSEVIQEDDDKNTAKSQSNSVHEIKNHYKIKDARYMHDHVMSEESNHSKSHNKRSRQSQSVGSMGAINKGIEMAKIQVLRQEKSNINKQGQSLQNKNLIKLSEIEQSTIHKRKRVQTQMYIEPQETILNKNNNKIVRKQLSECRNIKNRLIQEVDTPEEYQNRKETSKVSPINTPQERKSQSFTNGGSRIILYKGENVVLGSKIYNIEIFVENLSYHLLAHSLISKSKIFEEVIKISYQDYQELYRTKLCQSHEKILQYLKVKPENGLLHIEGIDSKYIDSFQHAQVEKLDSQRTKINVHLNNQQKEIADKIGETNSTEKGSKKQNQSQNQANENKDGLKRLQQFSSSLFNIQIEPVQVKIQREIPKGPITSKQKNVDTSEELAKQQTKKSSSKRQEQSGEFFSDVQPPNKPSLKKTITKEINSQRSNRSHAKNKIGSANPPNSFNSSGQAKDAQIISDSN